MTNFEIVTQTPDKLDQLLYMVQDDALAAKGCSYEMELPPRPGRSWKEWLEQETDLDICETPRGCIYPNRTIAETYGEDSEDIVQPESGGRTTPPSHVVWFSIPCPVCGKEKTNSWEKKISRALKYNGIVCETCIAKEYDVSVDELRRTMETHFGLVPCLGI